jgi:carotenoid cleavage dioxygenase-like enzyme
MLNPPETSNWQHVPDDEFSRWTLNLATGKAVKSIFLNQVDNIFVNMLDFPKINEEYRGLEYCYLYAESIVDYTRTAIVKKNVCDPSKDVVWYKENHYVSEVWFFPTPASEREGELAEDDGVLMTLVYDGERRMSYMMLLDAMSMESIATSYLPHRVPWSAHGHLFPEAQF